MTTQNQPQKKVGDLKFIILKTMSVVKTYLYIHWSTIKLGQNFTTSSNNSSRAAIETAAKVPA